MWGLLNIDKPPGLTSRDVINRLQGRLGRVKAGHAGTLDPLATGVLVVCLGSATRLVPFVQATRKQYVGVFRLGETSDTDDVSGQRVIRPVTAPPPRAAVARVLAHFTGTILQRPPSYSAVKVRGRRAYALARRGQPVQLEPRPVTIHQICLLEYAYPRLVLDVTCGSGTYLRALGRDIGDVLETGAVMSALRRTRVGPFQVADACQLQQLVEHGIEPHVQPPLRAVEPLPRVTLGRRQVTDIRHGRPIRHDQAVPSGCIAAVGADGQLVAILEPRSGRQLQPVRVFG